MLFFCNVVGKVGKMLGERSKFKRNLKTYFKVIQTCIKNTKLMGQICLKIISTTKPSLQFYFWRLAFSNYYYLL